MKAWWKKRSALPEQEDPAGKRFRQLIETAEAIAERNPRGLSDLVHAIARPFQSEALLAVAERGTDAIADIELSTLFGEAARRRFFVDGYLRGKRLPTECFRLRLGKHVVLPWPWKHSDYVSAVATIGTDKTALDGLGGRAHRSAWRQDSNHAVQLWLPWGIGEVCGGNHSIMAGILAGEGEIVPSAVYDMSCVLDDLRTDGMTWFDRKSGEKLGPVGDPRFAAIFEIGRIMVRTGFPSFHEEIRQAMAATT